MVFLLPLFPSEPASKIYYFFNKFVKRVSELSENVFSHKKQYGKYTNPLAFNVFPITSVLTKLTVKTIFCTVSIFSFEKYLIQQVDQHKLTAQTNMKLLIEITLHVIFTL